MNIAIDGPAGSGKSTIAKIAAGRLKFIYVDTGAMYRALALYCIRAGVDISKEEEVRKVLPDIHIRIAYDEDGQQVYLNGENVSGLIRTEQVSASTSKVSAYPCVRAKLLDLQRNLARENDVIMDGRDIGTNILPDAELKIYLTASVKERAGRRYKELLEKGEEVSLDQIEEEISQRDYQDKNRETAPLRQAEDAVYLDTTGLTIQQVSDKVCRLALGRMKEWK